MAPDAVSVAEEPLQILAAPPAVMVGVPFTVITLVAVLVQVRVLTPVTVYVVVTVVLVVTVAPVVALNPVAGVQV